MKAYFIEDSLGNKSDISFSSEDALNKLRDWKLNKYNFEYDKGCLLNIYEHQGFVNNEPTIVRSFKLEDPQSLFWLEQVETATNHVFKIKSHMSNGGNSLFTVEECKKLFSSRSHIIEYKSRSGETYKSLKGLLNNVMIAKKPHESFILIDNFYHLEEVLKYYWNVRKETIEKGIERFEKLIGELESSEFEFFEELPYTKDDIISLLSVDFMNDDNFDGICFDFSVFGLTGLISGDVALARKTVEAAGQESFEMAERNSGEYEYTHLGIFSMNPFTEMRGVSMIEIPKPIDYSKEFVVYIEKGIFLKQSDIDRLYNTINIRFIEFIQQILFDLKRDLALLKNGFSYSVIDQQFLD